MMPATTIAACGLAACTAFDIRLWSGLLATARARLEARGCRLAELARCRLCLGFHAAWIAAFTATHARAFGRAAVAVLAIHRLAHAVHDLTTRESASIRANDDRPDVKRDAERIEP